MPVDVTVVELAQNQGKLECLSPLKFAAISMKFGYMNAKICK